MKKEFRFAVFKVRFQNTFFCFALFAKPFVFDCSKQTRYNKPCQLLDIQTGKMDTVLSIPDHFEAPNWHPGIISF